MTQLQTFTHEQLGEIRTLTIKGEPWFIGKDVADLLGYEASRNALAKHVDEDDKLTHQISASGQRREMTIINESGLYSLILSSKLPLAKQFKRWVTSEVLPQIRKTGGYIPIEKEESELEILAKGFQILHRTLEEHKQILIEQAPKVAFANAVTTSDTCILVGEMAKLLKQNGVDIGQNRMFEWLRENGYLMKRRGSDYNMPTQISMDKGILSINENVKSHHNGCNIISKTTMVTGKGQIYFVNKLLAPSDVTSTPVGTKL